MRYRTTRTIISSQRFGFDTVVEAKDLGTEKDIERLLALGAIVPEEEGATSAPTSGPASVDGDTLEARVAQAIATLPAEGFTSGGKPKVEALQDALPEDAAAIDAALRDAVWVMVQAAKAS